jgi:phosphonate degradation associated HDIG domain protein
MNCIEYIVNLFKTRGDAEYFGEPVSQKEHALQCAALASQDGAPEALIAAALLHDIGHLLPGDEDLPPEADRCHEERAATWLRAYFEPDVTEPIRLHVLAKRYLCTVDPLYFGRLSQASIDSLMLQGGTLTPGERASFEKDRYFQSALRVRRWDEAAKQPGLQVEGLDAYVSMLHKLTVRWNAPLKAGVDLAPPINMKTSQR